jgi:periplasmic divalent cation tolerance protein
LVGEKLAACVQILGGGRSVYRWEGKLARASETLLIAKTRRARFPALLARVKQLHSYSVPEVVGLPISLANPDYLAWLGEST